MRAESREPKLSAKAKAKSGGLNAEAQKTIEKNNCKIFKRDLIIMADETGKNNNDNIKAKIVNGAVWVFVEKAGIGLLEFVAAWILARFFLDPADYTVVGIASIFIAFAGLFSQGSFNNALIQKKDIDEKDKSSVFWLVSAVTVLLYIIIFLAAPLVSSIYRTSELTLILRVQALSLIFDGLSAVMISLFTREFRFRLLFAKTLVSVVLSSGTGITAAVLGLGPWALVLQSLVHSAAGCVFCFFASKWKPQAVFSFKNIKKLSGFSWAMLVSNIINSIYSNTLPLAMKALYTENTLGYYNKSKTIPAKVSETINSTVTGLVFPSLSAFQEDREKMKAMTRKFVRVSSFAMFAAMAGLIAVARPMILFIYTEKWADSVVMLQFICVSLAFSPINSANLQAIKALGKGRIYLFLEIIKNVLGMCMLIPAMLLTKSLENGLYIVLGVQVLVSVICVIINGFPNKRLMNYSVSEQLRDYMPSLLLATFMGTAVYSVTLLGLGNLATLAIQLPLGVVIYLGGAKIFRMSGLEYIIDIIKSKGLKKE